MWWLLLVVLAGCSSSDATAEFPSLGEHEIIIVHDPIVTPTPPPPADDDEDDVDCPPFGKKAKGKGPCK